jgi:ABC-type transport system involved in multi-copper enzyme maturation permease subunit
MDLDQARYHGWQGRLQSPWLACLAIVRVALLQMFRNKAYWLLLGLGALRFLAFWTIIYAVTQLTLPPDVRKVLLKEFGFSANTDVDQNNGYIDFIDGQNIIVMILLAFAGSMLVGSDFRQKTLPFYLARRIDKRHYIVGKLLAVSSVIALLTVVPALLLFVEYGMFTSSLDYWIDNWRIAVSVLAFGLVICVVNSILLVTISAYLQRIVPITIAWASLFLLLGRLGGYLYRETRVEYWRLLDPWRDMRLVGRLCFGSFRGEVDRELAWWALAILGTLCAVALAALVHRVRAVDVVE